MRPGPEFPEPERPTDRLGAESGHPGRKRGEVQVARSVLQHAGSGVWLDMQVEPGSIGP